MDVVLSILQNIYFAWGVAILILIVAVCRAKSRGERYKNQISAIQEEASEKIQKANASANELIRQIRAKCDAEIQHEREAAAEAIKSERASFAERFKLLQEQIEADKTSIMHKTEKEIL